MQQIHFKKQFVPLILNGTKTSTARYSLKPAGEYKAVQGSRFKPKQFATILLTPAEYTQWKDIIANCYKEEGFATPEEMQAFLVKEKLVKGDLNDKVYRYVIRMVQP